jgi:PKD repeat protein
MKKALFVLWVPAIIILAAGLAGCGDNGNDEVWKLGITADPPSGIAPLEVTFTAIPKGDLAGKAGLTFIWVFGDGGTSQEQNPVHTFRTAGDYLVMCKVYDGDIDSETVVTGVTVN